MKDRFFIESLDHEFLRLHERSCELIEKTPENKLYWHPDNHVFPYNSCGECILRSAGAVEQTFGGITTRLWDDPFEWTLPESLPTKKDILDYLNEVEQTRKKGFLLFNSDEDLKKQIPAPQKLRPIFAVLLDTLLRAQNFQSRAKAILHLLSKSFNKP
ncbi:MAG: hypothetical protein N2Z23_09435 [Pyrinomonadaceae bacterium]|nr:hypothetical protein [Pyrinomonadaceae bacterium]MCX7640645.1 hypothetical protein [Pyrinomonadaceae bacterium]MDW8305346.1 hypothetical protein [Acidobacteriota bacterium]